MNRLLKLTNFELNRFSKILFGLLIAVLIIQLLGTILHASEYMNTINEAIHELGMNEDEALQLHGMMDVRVLLNSMWFVGPIFIGVSSVLFYIFLIWYRDWFGKNTFIYRLLTLPTDRINVYLAKLLAILAITLSFVAMQIVSLLLNVQVVKWIVPATFRIDYALRKLLLESNELMRMLYPSTFGEFMLHYGGGTVMVAIVFTAILFERSFRLPGVLLGAIYSVLACLVIFSPVILHELVFNRFFYPHELFLLIVGAGLVVLAISIWMSAWLLRKKIRV